MLDMLGEPLVVTLIGLAGGLCLGLAARLGRFCSMGAIEDALYGNDGRRLRMWGVAIGIAVIGSFLAMALGWFDPAQTLYLSNTWYPLASIAGGLVFGYGMALAGNCGFGALARVGGGDFRSFVIVLVMGLSAYIALSGPLAALRVWAFPVAAPEGQLPGIAHVLGGMTGLPVTVTGIVLGAALLVFSGANRRLLQSPGMVFWSVVVGLAIVGAWVGTSWVAAKGFEALPVVSHSFARPLGDSMLWLMMSSGLSINFAVGSVAGVLVGAFAGSLIKGHFRWEACEDPRELRRQIGGAALMGVGAAVAVGCTVGQGLSAFSVLAFSAPVTAAAIFAGAALGLKQLITGFVPAE
ncbi:YeeE/YedE family protein [Psychromarinibacter sp. C21-152]|uniref:YeeE/YedE family protein n=1 Tax=Psychromarinibacter sediminicola TaxID=3033385 RepID=A0AAE3T766_9RHOB|nr:YeeE/YedE family protein [Psychromarinibacter sediminicola]MDF0600020.1 YeeE/YedE family protein [Psychromarinibacter sediminicola]